MIKTYDVLLTECMKLSTPTAIIANECTVLFAGHKRTVSIPDCSDTVVITNGCRGYCPSWSIPSAVETLLMNPEQAITSMGQCCNIMDTEDVKKNNFS